MSISILCDCGKKLKVSDSLAGKKVKCPDCHKVSLVAADGGDSDHPAEHDHHLVHDDEDHGHKHRKKAAADDEHSNKARKPAGTEEADPEPARSGGIFQKLRLAAGLLVVLVVGGGGAGWYFGWHKMLVKADPPRPTLGPPSSPAPPSPFEPFVCVEGSFKARFPIKNPNPRDEPRDPRDNEAPAFKSYKGSLAGVEYKIAYADIPFLPADDAEVESWLKKRCDAAMKSTFKGTADKDEADPSLGVFPGRFLEISNPGAKRLFKVFIVNDRIYELWVYGKASLVNAKEAAEFFSGFALDPTPIKESSKQKEELKVLDGTWVITSFELDGQPQPPEKSPTELVFSGNKLTGLVGSEMTVRLDPVKTPKWADLVFKKDGRDTPLRTIYDVDGEYLKICYRTANQASAVESRPESFDAAGEKGYTLVRAQRAKKK